MRIMIDATSLLLRSAGVKTYMYHWVQALRRSATKDSVSLFPFGENRRPRSSGLVGGKANNHSRQAGGAFLEDRGNPALEVVGCAADVFHASQHLRNPPRMATRLTATIFDMTCWLMPGVHTAANVEASRMYGERVLRRAAACIAISEQSKRDAMDVLGLPAERIEVIYPGAAEQSLQRAAGRPSYRPEVRAGKTYILFVGTIEPRKNIDRLLDAYQSVRPSVREEHDLVIAGPLGWCSTATAERLSTEGHGVRYLGSDVPEDDLPGLTAGATMFIFPSLYEGFGLPLAQAMACGLPSITSRNSSLGEVAGDGAILVEPTDKEEIASAIESLALSPSLREDLGRRGRLRALNLFRWERNAERSLSRFLSPSGVGLNSADEFLASFSQRVLLRCCVVSILI